MTGTNINCFIRNDFAENAFQINDGLRETASCGNTVAYDSKYGLVFALYHTGLPGAYGESEGILRLSIFPPKQPWNARHVTLDTGVGLSRGLLCQALYLTGDAKVRALFLTDRGKELTGYYRDYDYFADKLSERQPLYLRVDDEDLWLNNASYTKYIESQGYSLELSAIEAASPEEYALIKNNKPSLNNPAQTPIINRVTEFGGELYTAVVLRGINYPVLCKIREDVLVPFSICPFLNIFEFRYYVDDTGIHGVYRLPYQDTGTGRCGYVHSADGGKSWEKKIFPDSIQSRPDILPYCGKPLIVYNYLSSEPEENYPPIHHHRNAIKMLYQDQTVFDVYSKYGIVEPEVIDICGDLYMVFSNCEQGLMFVNDTAWIEDGKKVENGKEKSNWIKLGCLPASFENEVWQQMRP